MVFNFVVNYMNGILCTYNFKWKKLVGHTTLHDNPNLLDRLYGTIAKSHRNFIHTNNFYSCKCQELLNESSGSKKKKFFLYKYKDSNVRARRYEKCCWWTIKGVVSSDCQAGGTARWRIEAQVWCEAGVRARG